MHANVVRDHLELNFEPTVSSFGLPMSTSAA
jgi:hypothetical protein